MPVAITQEKKKQKYLTGVLGLIIVMIIFVVWWGFLREEREGLILEEPEVSPVFKTPEINWQLLEDPQIEDLDLFEEVPPYEKEVGRGNPFMPY